MKPDVLRMPEKPTLKQKAGIPRRAVVEGTYTLSHVVIWAMLSGLLCFLIGLVLGTAN